MKRLTPIGLLEKEQVRFVGLALSFFVPNLGSEAYPEHTVIPPFGGLDPKRKTQGSLIERQFDLSGNRKVRVSDDFNIEFRLFRQDVVSDDTRDQVGDKIVDTAMSRVLYLADIFEHIIDRFDQGSLSQ